MPSLREAPDVQMLLERFLDWPASSDERPELEAELVELADKVYKLRRERDRIFSEGLFADPVWDILLDLYLAAGRGRDVAISSACLAASVPSTTGLRHIDRMVRAGLVERRSHPNDNRSALLGLTQSGRTKMSLWLGRLKTSGTI